MAEGVAPEFAPLRKALFIVGGQRALAKAIGCSQNTIHRWLWKRGGVPTSFEYCRKIEEATNGMVKVKDLVPGFFD